MKKTSNISKNRRQSIINSSSKRNKKNLNGLAKRLQNEEIQGYINKMVEEKYSTNLIKTKYVDDSKITDHYAIINRTRI